MEIRPAKSQNNTHINPFNISSTPLFIDRIIGIGLSLLAIAFFLLIIVMIFPLGLAAGYAMKSYKKNVVMASLNLFKNIH